MGMFDSFYKSKEAKDFYRDAKLFDEKDLEQIKEVARLEEEVKKLREEIEMIADQYTFSEEPMTPQAELIKKRGLMVEENKRLRKALEGARNKIHYFLQINEPGVPGINALLLAKDFIHEALNLPKDD